MVNESLLSRVGERLTKVGGGLTATDTFKRMEKLNTMLGFSHTQNYGGMNRPDPPYQRNFSPLWIYKIRRDSSLINNAVSKKVGHVFDDGFAEWEKSYEAKCPHCEHEFDSLDAFRNQMGEEGQELDEEDFDFDSERTCPECEEVGTMYEPEEEVREHAQEFFDKANSRPGDDTSFLEPDSQSSVSQTFEEVCIEVARDLESFDDGWMVFDRSYLLDDDGRIIDYELEEVFRAPPELMRYSFDDETNDPGGEFWVCPRCRASIEDYYPEEEDCACSNCGNATYEAFAYASDTPGGKESEWFIRGEFVHDSVHEPSRFYGYAPILSLWEEARTLEQMDSWYHDAYEERRAPRGAITVNAARDEELRTLNYQQMEELREDPNYIPFFMNDQETEGDPIQFVELLSDPAEMQHMEMREWFLDRISAKYGVTAVLQKASPGDSGLTQSMEVEVSQKAAENLREAFHRSYIPAFLDQIGTEGWTKELPPTVEEDENEEAQMVGQHLNNAQKAIQMGAEVVWTEDDRADIKHGELEPPEDEMDGMGGMMGGGGMDMMGMDGGLDDDRGPEPHSLEPGDDHTVDEAGERAEGPDDPDRPSAQPLERALSEAIPDEDRLEKIASASFGVQGESDSQQIAEEVLP